MQSSLLLIKRRLGVKVGLVGNCAFVLVEHLHDDDVVVVLELLGVHRRRAHDAWRCLALHGDVDHKRDGGRHVDVDVDDLRLHCFCAPKTCDLNVAALRMMNGKNS